MFPQDYEILWEVVINSRGMFQDIRAELHHLVELIVTTEAVHRNSPAGPWAEDLCRTIAALDAADADFEEVLAHESADDSARKTVVLDS